MKCQEYQASAQPQRPPPPQPPPPPQVCFMAARRNVFADRFSLDRGDAPTPPLTPLTIPRSYACLGNSITVPSSVLSLSCGESPCVDEVEPLFGDCMEDFMSAPATPQQPFASPQLAHGTFKSCRVGIGGRTADDNDTNRRLATDSGSDTELICDREHNVRSALSDAGHNGAGHNDLRAPLTDRHNEIVSIPRAPAPRRHSGANHPTSALLQGDTDNENDGRDHDGDRDDGEDSLLAVAMRLDEAGTKLFLKEFSGGTNALLGSDNGDNEIGVFPRFNTGDLSDRNCAADNPARNRTALASVSAATPTATTLSAPASSTSSSSSLLGAECHKLPFSGKLTYRRVSCPPYLTPVRVPTTAGVTDHDHTLPQAGDKRRPDGMVADTLAIPGKRRNTITMDRTLPMNKAPPFCTFITEMQPGAAKGQAKVSTLPVSSINNSNSNNKINNNNAMQGAFGELLLSRAAPGYSRMTLDGHRDADQAAQLVRCTYTSCEKFFDSERSMRSHARIHCGERSFQCSSCILRFSRNHDLKRHERIHSGVRPYVCVHCEKTFLRLDALNRHLKVNNGKGCRTRPKKNDGDALADFGGPGATDMYESMMSPVEPSLSQALRYTTATPPSTSDLSHPPPVPRAGPDSAPLKFDMSATQ